MSTETKPAAETILDVVKQSADLSRAHAREQAEARAAAATAESGDKAKPVAAFKAVSVDDQGVILFIGAAAENVDHDDEILRKGALLQMAFDFCASKAREFRANHQDVIACELVASWPGAPILKSGKTVAAGEDLPEDDEIIGINVEKGKESHWFLQVRPLDEAVKKAAAEGKIVGGSWAGFVTREPVKE